MARAEQTTSVAWRELEAAFCDTSPGFRRYLDRARGRVLALHAHVEYDAPALRRVAQEPERFVRIDTISSHEQHGWMAKFAGTVRDPELRGRLELALAASGAFRLFKQILREQPSEERRWLDYRSEILRVHIEAWLGLRGIDVREPPRARVSVVEATAPSPAEAAALRQSARASLDELPADALTLAIGFLRYLEARAANRDAVDPGCAVDGSLGCP